MKTIIAVVLAALVCGCSSNSGGSEQSAGSPSTSQTQAAASSTQTQAAAPSTAVMKVLHDSTVTFKTAQTACAGALGSLTFSLGHARAHAASGASLKESETAATGIDTMVFTDASSGQTSTVEVNGHKRSVTGKNVTVKMNGSVACIGAE